MNGQIHPLGRQWKRKVPLEDWKYPQRATTTLLHRSFTSAARMHGVSGFPYAVSMLHGSTTMFPHPLHMRLKCYMLAYLRSALISACALSLLFLSPESMILRSSSSKTTAPLPPPAAPPVVASCSQAWMCAGLAAENRVTGTTPTSSTDPADSHATWLQTLTAPTLSLQHIQAPACSLHHIRALAVSAASHNGDPYTRICHSGCSTLLIS